MRWTTFKPNNWQCSFFPIFPISFRKNPGALKRRLDADCITSCALVSGGFFGSWTTNGGNEFLPGFCRVLSGFYLVLPTKNIKKTRKIFEESWLAIVHSHLKHLVMFKTISNKEMNTWKLCCTVHYNEQRKHLKKNMTYPSGVAKRSEGRMKTEPPKTT